MTDVSVFLARLIRETYRGDIDHEKAGRLAYMCNCLRASLEASDLERRIEELEARANQAGAGTLKVAP